MGKRVTPRNVAEVFIYPANDGIRFSCRDEGGKVIYDSPRFFPNRYSARKDALRRWPEAKIVFGA